jgi:Ca2+-dependent lipid-binding protein
MERREKSWPEDGNPWLDHVVEQRGQVGNQQDQQDRFQSGMKFPRSMTESRESFLRLVHHFREKILNIFDHSTLAETLLFSVSMTLISFVIFWMSFTFVILGGSLLILMLLTTLMVKYGRKMRMFATSIRARLNAARGVPELDSANDRITSTSEGTQVSNS